MKSPLLAAFIFTLIGCSQQNAETGSTTSAIAVDQRADLQKARDTAALLQQSDEATRKNADSANQ